MIWTVAAVVATFVVAWLLGFMMGHAQGKLTVLENDE